MLTGLMRMTVGAACLILMGLVGSAAAQEAPAEDRFAAGEEAYGNADLETALAHYEAAWREGIEDRGRLALVHLRLGTLHAMLGREQEARSAFAVAVALDASLEAPPELPPALQGLFEDAMEARSAYTLDAEVLEAGPPTAIRVTPSASLEGVAETLSVAVDGDAPQTPTADAPSEFTLPLSRFAEDDTLVVLARALDAHGGVLAETRVDVARPAPRVAVAFPDSPPAPLPNPALPPDDEGDGDVFASPWFWLTGALVVLAVGGLTVGLAVGLGQDVYTFGRPTVMR